MNCIAEQLSDCFHFGLIWKCLFVVLVLVSCFCYRKMFSLLRNNECVQILGHFPVLWISALDRIKV